MTVLLALPTGSVTSQLDVYPEHVPSETGYSLVTPVAAPAEPSAVDLGATGGTNIGLPAQGLPLTWPQREVIARDIGQWVQQSVRGLRRGPSGRDRLPYSSRVWVVFKDFAGDIQEPAGVYNQWQACRLQVKRGAGFGESVFIGLPSLREARWVVEAAGFQWPL